MFCSYVQYSIVGCTGYSFWVCIFRRQKLSSMTKSIFQDNLFATSHLTIAQNCNSNCHYETTLFLHYASYLSVITLYHKFVLFYTYILIKEISCNFLDRLYDIRFRILY